MDVFAWMEWGIGSSFLLSLFVIRVCIDWHECGHAFIMCLFHVFLCAMKTTKQCLFFCASLVLLLQLLQQQLAHVLLVLLLHFLLTPCLAFFTVHASVGLTPINAAFVNPFALTCWCVVCLSFVCVWATAFVHADIAEHHTCAGVCSPLSQFHCTLGKNEFCSLKLRAKCLFYPNVLPGSNLKPLDPFGRQEATMIVLVTPPPKTTTIDCKNKGWWLPLVTCDGQTMESDSGFASSNRSKKGTVLRILLWATHKHSCCVQTANAICLQLLSCVVCLCFVCLCESNPMRGWCSGSCACLVLLACFCWVFFHLG